MVYNSGCVIIRIIDMLHNKSNKKGKDGHYIRTFPKVEAS